MKIEPLKDFLVRTSKSRSTIIRFYKRNPELKLQIVTKAGKGLYPIEHAKYFDSEKLFEENKKLWSENKSMKRLIDNLRREDQMHNWLSAQEWHCFGTIAYKNNIGILECHKRMTELFNALNLKFTGTRFKLFFTTESFTTRPGYHNHFTLHVENTRIVESVKEFIEKHFSKDRVDISSYDSYRPAFGYILKSGPKGESWDFLGTTI